MKTKKLLSVVLGTSFLLTGQLSLASGGPVDERTVECRGGKGPGGAVPLVVFRLSTAPSSETRGDVLVYDNEKARSKMKTAMANCFELAHSTPHPAVTHTGEKILVCGNVEAAKEQRGTVRVRPNNTGFRAILLEEKKAHVEKVDASGAISPVYGELSCTEKK
jgi:hypothetical protein